MKLIDPALLASGWIENLSRKEETVGAVGVRDFQNFLARVIRNGY